MLVRDEVQTLSGFSFLTIIVIQHVVDGFIKKKTLLHWACESGKLDLVKFLVEECNCDLRE